MSIKWYWWHTVQRRCFLYADRDLYILRYFYCKFYHIWLQYIRNITHLYQKCYHRNSYKNSYIRTKWWLSFSNICYRHSKNNLFIYVSWMIYCVKWWNSNYYCNCANGWYKLLRPLKHIYFNWCIYNSYTTYSNSG